jgi:O-antigen ligase
MIRWLAYGLMALSLAAAVLLNGGAHSAQWQWSALGLSLGAVLALLSREERDRWSGEEWGFVFLGLLIVWMMLQWLPIPIWALKRLAPGRWAALAAVRAATGLDMDTWASLSTAPAATLDRFSNVVAATAAFLATSQMACWWRNKIWIVIAPVVAVAFPESVLGILQFYWMRVAHGSSDPATGTYVYHNHFAGLLEMGFPLAALWAVWIWKQGASRHHPEGMAPALKTTALFGIAACILAVIVVSLSRMGFVSMLAAIAIVGIAILATWRRRSRRNSRRWLWAVPVAVPVMVVLLLLPPNELIARFSEVTTDPGMTVDARTNIWRDTLSEVAASPWTGVGLGAYEHGLYRFKTTAPTNTVDFAHNDYLQILAELGIPGATLAAALGVWMLLRCSSVVLSARKGMNWEFAAGLLVALVTLGLHSLADFNLYSPANALVLAWIGGVAVSPGLRESLRESR